MPVGWSSGVRSPGPTLLAGFLLWPGRPPAWTESARSEFAGRYLSELRQSRPAWLTALRDEDVDAWLTTVLRDVRSPLEGWAALLASADIAADWSGSEPRIPLDGFEAWLSLLDEVEPDCALISALGRLLTRDIRTPAHLPDSDVDWTAKAEQTIERLPDWPTIVRATHFDLDQVTRRRLTDLHVHLGGSRAIPRVWMDLAWRGRSLDAFSPPPFGLVPAAIEKVRQGLESHAALKTALGLANTASPREPEAFEPTERQQVRAELLDRLGFSDLLREPADAAPQELARRAEQWSLLREMGLLDGSDPGPETPREIERRQARAERILLLTSWLRGFGELMRGGASSVAKDDSFSARLDQIFIARCLIWKALRQRAFSSAAGLERFSKIHFRAAAPKPRARATHRFRPHRDTEIAEQVRQIAVLAETPSLRSLELRIKPYTRAVDYPRQLHEFDLECQEYGLRGLDTRFVVHFMRERKPKPSDLIRERLSREAATFHLARFKYEEIARRFRRIDVAGAESVTHGEPFVHYLRVLRGEPDAIEDLRQCLALGDRDKDSAWQPVLMQAPSAPAIGGRLRATWHAGEDFGDVLEGLYEIGIALDGLGLKAGDGIGHGLALAADPRGGDRAEGFYGLVTAGLHLDSMLWLQDLLVETGQLSASHLEASALEAEIDRTFRHIYQDDALHARGFARRLHLLRLRPIELVLQSSDPCVPLLRQEIDGKLKVGERRSEMVDRRAFILSIVDLLRAAQKTLLQRVVERRIVIELNPSSNLRIYGARSISALPTVSLAQACTEGLLATICTDDPGPFASRIEHEYAILFLGLEQRGWEPGRIVDLLEQLRSIGVATAEDDWSIRSSALAGRGTGSTVL